jgi:hypothetical protein
MNTFFLIELSTDISVLVATQSRNCEGTFDDFCSLVHGNNTLASFCQLGNDILPRQHHVQHHLERNSASKCWHNLFDKNLVFFCSVLKILLTVDGEAPCFAFPRFLVVMEITKVMLHFPDIVVELLIVCGVPQVDICAEEKAPDCVPTVPQSSGSPLQQVVNPV